MCQIDILAAPHRLSFYNSQSRPLLQSQTAYRAWCIAMARPLFPFEQALAIHNAVSARFGVKRIGGFTAPARPAPKSGDMLDFFAVERSEPTILTLTARDRHLDVMICITSHDQIVTITASVITHNVFGRAYMLPVAPAHRLIVWLMLRRCVKSLRN